MSSGSPVSSERVDARPPSPPRTSSPSAIGNSALIRAAADRARGSRLVECDQRADVGDRVVSDLITGGAPDDVEDLAEVDPAHHGVAHGSLDTSGCRLGSLQPPEYSPAVEDDRHRGSARRSASSA